MIKPECPSYNIAIKENQVITGNKYVPMCVCVCVTGCMCNKPYFSKIDTFTLLYNNLFILLLVVKDRSQKVVIYNLMYQRVNSPSFRLCKRSYCENPIKMEQDKRNKNFNIIPSHTFLILN